MKNLILLLSLLFTGNLFAQPVNPAGDPTHAAANVISMFSGAYTNVTVDTWRTSWSSAVLEDIQIQGNDTKKYSALDFVGVETVTSQMNLTNMTHMHLDFWTPDMTTFRVKLVDFGADGAFAGGDDTEHELVFSNPAQSQWISLNIPLANFTNLVNKGHIAQVIFSGLPVAGGTVYLDNIYFYKDAVLPSEPIAAAPNPTHAAANVISMFSNVYTNVAVDTWRTSWSSATLEDIQIQGNDTKKYSALDFVGVETVANQMNLTNMTHMHLDIWTPNMTTFRVKLVDFGADGAFAGGDDTDHELVFSNPAQSQWISLNIPLADFTNLVNKGHVAQVIFSGLPVAGGTVYIDNVYFYKDAVLPTAPIAAAPNPTHAAANVISMFSNVYTNVTIDTWRTSWSSATLEDIQIQGNDTKKYSALDFVGVETVANQMNLTNMTHMHLDMWTPNMTTFRVKLVDFGADGAFAGGDDTEHELVFSNPAQAQWVSLNIPLADFTNLVNKGHVAQVIFSGLPTAGGTVYLDNIYFYQDAVLPSEPIAAAPNPTHAAANVISMFSNVYTNVTVDTWRTSWSSATLEDIQIQGNDTKKYSALDFVGVETVANQMNLTNMTHMHLDMWTPNMTTFRVKLVDFGADGAFAGGDDTEHELVFSNPAQAQWVSLNIPLADFTNLVNKGHVAQVIFSGLPTAGGTVYLDNIYFYKDAVLPTAPIAAAPNPTHAAANVISMFSNVYTNVTVDTWRTSWSSAVLEDIQIQGNDTKKYSALDFVGVETVTNQMNLTNMTHMHLDMWTPNMTTFRVKLVDFGADGAFAGGDDTEHELVFSNPAQAQWVSLNIPLADFTNLVNKGHVAQVIFSGLPTAGGTVYLDNVYFYKATVSTNDVFGYDVLKIYPNPVSIGQTIQMPVDIKRAQIFDAYGRSIQQIIGSEITTNNLNSGWYIIKAEDNNGKYLVNKVLIR
jgi:hypothetical protein